MKILLCQLLLVYEISCHISPSNENEVAASMNLFNNEEIAACFGDLKTPAINEMSEDSNSLIASSQKFAFELFKTLSRFEVKSSSRGLIFSPASIWSTLIITYLGSKNETAKELKKQMKLDQLSKTSVAIAYKNIKLLQNLKAANDSSGKTQLSDVNKIFLASQLRVNPCFRNIFPQYIETKNFLTEPRESLAAINDWIQKQTSGKIVDLIPSGSISSMTKMVIANAVYFKSTWAHRFDVSKTKRDKFIVSPEEEIQVDMMSMESVSILYGVSETMQATAIELPYSSDQYSMLIVLPSPQKGIDSLLRELTVDKLQELFDSMYEDDVNINLPKFKAEQEFDLAGPLYSMGIKKVFDPRYVDLSLIFDEQDSSSSKHQAALDSVLHKTYVSVDEDGTTAAAATALIFARSGRPLYPTEFIANRPFMYLIRDTSTNMILFMGTVRRPQSSSST